jgi:type IV secretory pathway ATPase VirB11/archaellum biosynthesis ATPase
LANKRDDDEMLQLQGMISSLIAILVFQIEQYKSVVFYGPKGMGKTYLVKKLAQCIQVMRQKFSVCLSYCFAFSFLNL